MHSSQNFSSNSVTVDAYNVPEELVSPSEALGFTELLEDPLSSCTASDGKLQCPKGRNKPSTSCKLPIPSPSLPSIWSPHPLILIEEETQKLQKHLQYHPSMAHIKENLGSHSIRSHILFPPYECGFY